MPQPLLEFCSEFGRAYLASGGPTSRLEEYVTELGRVYEHPTEVFATPTGVFVSLVDKDGMHRTTLSRVKQVSMNLGRLCWLEGIFEDITTKKITLSQGLRVLGNKKVRNATYPLWVATLAAFVGGFALSLPNYGRVRAALASGLIAMVTWWISGPGLNRRIQSSIFRDFIGCTAALALAATAQFFIPGPFEAFAIGALIVLVPGLALTSAISELADQNLVSGTAKLMQAILTLLALGISYLLFTDLVSGLGLHSFPMISAERRPLSLGASAVGAAFGVTCFGILFGVPRKALPGATATGLLGWTVFHQFDNTKLLVTAPFLASTAVGFVSLVLSNRFKVPSQTYSVPGILAMLPGMLALASFHTLALGNETVGIELGFRVATTAAAIVFGLFAARIPFTLWQVTRIRLKKVSPML